MEPLNFVPEEHSLVDVALEDIGPALCTGSAFSLLPRTLEA